MATMRLAVLLLPVFLVPLALAGCASGLEEAAELASRARAERDDGNAAEALRRLARAGDFIRGDADDDLRARYLLAAIYYNMHLMGAPSAFPVGEPAFEWAAEALRESGEPDFLALAFSQMLTLEKQTFTIEGIPGWATVDRLLISADALRVRADAVIANLPSATFAGVPPEFAAAHMRIAVLEIVRSFCIQAWRRALDASQTVEPSRTRLAAVYRSTAEAWDRLAAASPDGGPRKAAEAEAERFRGLAERAAIMITPEDLGHPVEREMLKLVSDDHLREGRRTAMQGFDEKKAGNRARASATIQSSIAHFVNALAIGIPDASDRRSAEGYLHDLVLGLRELER